MVCPSVAAETADRVYIECLMIWDEISGQYSRVGHTVLVRCSR